MKTFTESDLYHWRSRDGEPMQSLSTEREDLLDDPLWFHEADLFETASGYGSKLRTRWKVNFEGRLFRIYCTLWGNAGTCWIKTRGRTIIVR